LRVDMSMKAARPMRDAQGMPVATSIAKRYTRM